MAKIVLMLFLLFVLLLAISFSVINAHNVQLNYYLGEVELPLSFLIIAALLLGAVLGATAMTKTILKSRVEISRLKKAVKVNEKEIANLRSIPVKER